MLGVESNLDALKIKLIQEFLDFAEITETWLDSLHDLASMG